MRQDDILKGDSFLVECYIKVRANQLIDNEQPLFSNRDEGIFAKLYRYAVVPREEYDAIIESRDAAMELANSEKTFFAAAMDQNERLKQIHAEELQFHCACIKEDPHNIGVFKTECMYHQMIRESGDCEMVLRKTLQEERDALRDQVERLEAALNEMTERHTL
jgi:hypothetical protein